MRPLAFATFLVWRLRTDACDVGACGFWRYRMPPFFSPLELAADSRFHLKYLFLLNIALYVVQSSCRLQESLIANSFRIRKFRVQRLRDRMTNYPSAGLVTDPPKWRPPKNDQLLEGRADGRINNAGDLILAPAAI